MCGIAGIYGLHKTCDAKKMVSNIKHRGPDGFGLWSDEQSKISLGHVRLSIIDTSLAGGQPMSFDNERYWITFNGEIYNYNELKVELLEKGCVFKTNSDTEVVLASFSVWGKSCVKKFIGMFSFAIYDKYASTDDAKLILFRDRFGIKPLLYKYIDNTLYFASEINSFSALDFDKFKINEDSILEYLSFGTIFQPNTIIKDIYSVPSASFIEVFDDHIEVTKYWDLHEATKSLRNKLSNISYECAVDNIRILLDKAINYNLVSDVEISVFLSGGIDSTAILGLMDQYSNSKIHTYSIGFENKFSFMDETKYANIAADHFKSNHNNFIVNNENILEIFDNIINSIDQPSLDGTNTWLVSKRASDDVKVALSGLGGDEIFAGYPHFHSIYKNYKKHFYGNSLINNIINFLHQLKPNFFTLKLLARFSPYMEYLSNQRRVMENFEIKKFVKSKWRHSYILKIESIYNKWMLNDADIIQQISYVEIMGYLQNILLRDSDIMSMAHGIEVRPVLLDHNLVEYVYSLPAEIKMNKHYNKKIFLDAVNDIFPGELKNRKKMGFELPFISWIEGPLKLRFENLFQSEIAKKIFKENYIKKQLHLIKIGKPTHSIWTIGILIAWLDKNNIEL